MSDQHIETVKNLKKKLDKGVSFEKTMHILYKLQKIPISVKLLEETGIGHKLRELSKKEQGNDIGKTAKLLIMGWKQHLRSQNEEDLETDSRDQSRRESASSSYRHSEPDDRRHNQDSVNSDGYENNDETGCDEDGDDDTPPRSSDRSEEGSSKKKHKKKKKQKNRDSDDDQRKKDKKRKHRENNDCIDRESSSSKRHRSSEHSPNKSQSCDMSHNRMGGDDGRFQQRSDVELNNRQQPPAPTAPRRLISDNDIFGAVLNLGDKAQSFQNHAKNSLKTNGAPRMLSCTPAVPSSQSSYRQTSMAQTYGSTSGMGTTTSNKNQDLVGMKFKGRTQVFAGTSRTPLVPKVYNLQDLCKKVLMNNIDKIYEVGDLPYFILKPVFQRCNVQQLRHIEKFNPQLLEETDELWREFCEKDFKSKLADHKRFESWRDFYNHLVHERDQKLENITKKISTKQREAIPERKTQKLEVRKIPREVRRRAERSANLPTQSVSSAGKTGFNFQASKNSKPKRAPLMQKLLNIRNGKTRR